MPKLLSIFCLFMVYLMSVRNCDYEESKERGVEGGGRGSILGTIASSA